MSNKSKKYIVISIFVVIVIIFIILILKNNKKRESKIENEIDIFVQTLEDGTKLNTSSKLNEVKKIGNLEISNSQLTSKNGKTILLADVKNTGSTKVNMLEIKIILIDINNKEIEILDGLLGTIKPGESAELNVAITGDYTNIYDYKLKID